VSEAALEGVTLLVEDVRRSKELYMRIPGAAVMHKRVGESVLLRIGHVRLQCLRMGICPPPRRLASI
jgi:hypothetical protein